MLKEETAAVTRDLDVIVAVRIAIITEKYWDDDNMNEERISPFMLAFIADMNEKNGYEEEDFSNT